MLFRSLERYHRFLVDDRGLAAVVVAQYETGARLFVDFVTERDVDLGEVSALDVSMFVTRHCARPVKLAPPNSSRSCALPCGSCT